MVETAERALQRHWAARQVRLARAERVVQDTSEVSQVLMPEY
jgi:hypothetical protein